MDTKLLDYIKELSKRDKKTLSQKALKVSEEQGELAKAVLPFDSAYACRHRFVNKYKILEEVADTVLAAISIAYDLDFTHEDIENMISEKAQKWQGLQVSEDDAKFPIPFEIHITVERDDEVKFEEFSSKFKLACEKIGVKPIVLDLSNKDGSTIKDAMTSSNFYGDNRAAYEELQKISGQLTRLGYKVVREKIETAPWHPGAPKKEGDSMPKNCYFESHISVEIDDSKEKREELERLASRLNAHVSKNTFKKIDDGIYILMLTIRDQHVCRSEFEEKIKNAISEIKGDGWVIPQKEIIEFAIYDTKVSHDYLWLK
jgi:NTP pyrophosphatase (non-canonical NTP hydrolase)